MIPIEAVNQLYTLAHKPDVDEATRRGEMTDFLLTYDAEQRGLTSAIDLFLKSLHLRPGTVIAFRQQEGVQIDIATLMNMSRMFPPGVLCLCLRPGLDIDKVSVEEMKGYGWQRIPTNQTVTAEGIDASNWGKTPDAG
jgi:hypothetical protein